MKKIQMAINSLQNQVVNYRPSDNEIKYQFSQIKEMTTDKIALASIANLENLVLNVKVSNEELEYQFNSLKKSI